jgi:hypothetical protein
VFPAGKQKAVLSAASVGHHGILRNKSGVRKNILKRWQCHVASRATDFEREDEQLQPNEPRRRVTFLK